MKSAMPNLYLPFFEVTLVQIANGEKQGDAGRRRGRKPKEPGKVKVKEEAYLSSVLFVHITRTMHGTLAVSG